jgi:chemotaxis protein methyltransferase CheR
MLTSQDIDAVCGLVMDLCGVYLDESKGYLIEARLAELVKSANCESYADFARKARSDPPTRDKVIDAITTNETLFFRDSSPFDALTNKVVPSPCQTI